MPAVMSYSLPSHSNLHVLNLEPTQCFIVQMIFYFMATCRIRGLLGFGIWEACNMRATVIPIRVTL